MSEPRDAVLLLENGRAFHGTALGAQVERFGEVVFNTSMTGYQEILTDPSYRGQILCMTAPQIGNYGVNADDIESGRLQMAGFVVREASRIASNFTATGTLGEYLAKAGVVGLAGIDTRSLVRRLRIRGAMTGVISSEVLDPSRLVDLARRAPALVGRDLVGEVMPEALRYSLRLCSLRKLLCVRLCSRTTNPAKCGFWLSTSSALTP